MDCDFPSRHRSAWPGLGTGWDSEIAGSRWRGPVPRVPMAQWGFHGDFHGDFMGTYRDLMGFTSDLLVIY